MAQVPGQPAPRADDHHRKHTGTADGDRVPGSGNGDKSDVENTTDLSRPSSFHDEVYKPPKNFGTGGRTGLTDLAWQTSPTPEAKTARNVQQADRELSAIWRNLRSSRGANNTAVAEYLSSLEQRMPGRLKQMELIDPNRLNEAREKAKKMFPRKGLEQDLLTLDYAAEHAANGLMPAELSRAVGICKTMCHLSDEADARKAFGLELRRQAGARLAGDDLRAYRQYSYDSLKSYFLRIGSDGKITDELIKDTDAEYKALPDALHMLQGDITGMHSRFLIAYFDPKVKKEVGSVVAKVEPKKQAGEAATRKETTNSSGTATMQSKPTEKSQQKADAKTQAEETVQSKATERGESLKRWDKGVQLLAQIDQDLAAGSRSDAIQHSREAMAILGNELDNLPESNKPSGRRAYLRTMLACANLLSHAPETLGIDQQLQEAGEAIQMCGQAYTFAQRHREPPSVLASILNQQGAAELSLAERYDPKARGEPNLYQEQIWKAHNTLKIAEGLIEKQTSNDDIPLRVGIFSRLAVAQAGLSREPGDVYAVSSDKNYQQAIVLWKIYDPQKNAVDQEEANARAERIAYTIFANVLRSDRYPKLLKENGEGTKRDLLMVENAALRAKYKFEDKDAVKEEAAKR